MTAVNKHTLWAIGVALALTACSDDGDNPAALTPVPLQILASIVQQAETRVTAASKWETGDCIYIRGVKGGTVESGLNNALYICAVDGDKVTFTPDSGTDYYFQDTQSVTLTAVCIPGSKGSDIPTDGVLTELSAGDFLFATATASYAGGNVELKFAHQMARVMFRFKNGNADFTTTELASFTFDVSGLVTTGQFDTTTGTATAGSSSTLKGMSANTYIAVYPSSKAEDVDLEFTFGSVEYEVTLSSIQFEAGKSYEYTVTVPSN